MNNNPVILSSVALYVVHRRHPEIGGPEWGLAGVYTPTRLIDEINHLEGMGYQVLVHVTSADSDRVDTIYLTGRDSRDHLVTKIAENLPAGK